MKEPFTKEEREIMNLITDIHSKFIKLDRFHPDEIKEWVNGIHAIQDVLMRRVTTRDYPSSCFKIDDV